MNNIILTALSVCLSFSVFPLSSSENKTYNTTVTVDYATQRYLNDVSALDRGKYFNIHTSKDSDPDVRKFLADYGVGIGRSFWGPFSYSYGKTKKVGEYPFSEKPLNYTDLKETKRYVATEHANARTIQWGIDPVKAGAWAAEYYSKHVKGAVPEFFEPINEPFVHARDKCFNMHGQEMRMLMADFYAQTGKHIHAEPSLKKMKIIGYAAAYPAMELRDFDHWNNTMKMFIDRAGEYMDGLSVHLYDGINIVGKSSRRSGSNSEAILDLMENYSFIRLGKVLPLAVTEYGGIDNTSKGYNPIASVRTVASFNHILFNLLEREDKMLISIPFVSDKAEWHITKQYNFEPYGAALFVANNPHDLKNTAWKLNDKKYFFKLWKDVKGERVDIVSDNPDIQVAAFKDDDRLYIAVDNLDDYTHKVNLKNVLNWKGVDNVSVRSLKMIFDKGIVYDEKTLNSMPQSIDIIKDETIILCADIIRKKYSNRIVRTKYYSNTYLQPVEAGKPIVFDFDGLKPGTGRAVLRMSIGRKHEMSKKPEIMVNGKKVDMPDNWRGYDQTGRDDFFGMIEIPFDYRLIRKGKNSVSVTFPDNGGRVATMILQTERYDKKVRK
ncbi:beta-porphyranase A [Phocaeicola vulgatus]|uniref:beta-porphyranase A n=1 Tax=Phocaeicola vulgatus TaxID=821 RepID=UPI0039F5C0AC